MSAIIVSTDPRTGEASPTDLTESTAEQVAMSALDAAAAFDALGARDRAWRAGLLRALADALEHRRDDLVATADRETGLGPGRLTGELTRSAFQFRLFGEAVDEGGYLEAAIDHAGDTPMGPGPELRRMLVPLGPVAVFGSSNFPFAFSVAGGDTASALAAGCPVVAKAHSSHPLTSQLSFETLRDAAIAYGAPRGTVSLVFGTDAGRTLVADPRVRAVGFTGSTGAADALMAIIAERREPIPFYGELSSVNPLIVSPAAATARAASIAEGLFGSFTLGAGQFCTKPGLAFVPTGPDGDAVVTGLAERVRAASPQPLLNSRIRTSFDEIEQRLTSSGHALPVAAGPDGDVGFSVAPRLLAIGIDELVPATTEEAFGPLLVVVRYDDPDQIVRALRTVPGSLTATIHSEPEERGLTSMLATALRDLVGRIVFNGYPTGVRVGWAQQHGGPWPATNSIHTSVGVTAMRRFLRPVAWQDAPAEVLPVELRDDCVSIPRRIDGVLVPATAARG